MALVRACVAFFAVACAAASCSGGGAGSGAAGPDPALDGAIRVLSPRPGETFQTHAVPVSAALDARVAPGSLTASLDGEDATARLRVRGGVAKANLTGLAPGEHRLVLRAEGAAKAAGASFTRAEVRFRYAPKPIDAVPAGATYEVAGLTGRVEVLTDPWGVRHVYTMGGNAEDLAFAGGYVGARDRLFQMDFFRKVAEGRLTELLGEDLDPTILRMDVEMRTVFTTRDGRPIYDVLVDHLRTADPEGLELVEGFAAGVTAYIEDLEAGRNDALRPYPYDTIDLLTALTDADEPYRIAPFTAADVLAIGRFQQWVLSNSLFEEIGFLENWCRIAEAETRDDLPPGSLEDLYRAAPLDDAVVLAPGEIGAVPEAGRSRDRAPPARPDLGRLCAAMKARPRVGGGAGVADKAFRKGATRFASNNWAISGRLTESGFGIFANDPHLPLINPTTLYPIHADNKTFSGGRFNFSGFTFPGIPSVLIGQNERLAWGATIALYDVTSVYLEEVTSGPGGKTVRFRGEDVPVLTVPAVFKIRGKADRVVPIDVVPHHGPQVPDPDPTDGVSGIEATGMSLRWTGHEPSLETTALRGLVLADGADDFMDAMAFFGVGAQNFLSTDADGVVAYSPHAYIPVLTAGARSEETPPYIVQPGDGSAEWAANPDGSPRWVPDHRIPQAKDPAAGFLVTTNNDITGVAQDGNPLNDDLYLYARIADGVRAGQALAELTAAPEGSWTPEQSMRVQTSHRARYAERFLPFLFAALEDEAALAGFSPEARARIAAARARLGAWDLGCPTGVPDPFSGAAPSAEDAESSVGCSIFFVWLARFGRLALDDELAAAGISFGTFERGRALLHLLEDAGRTEPSLLIHSAGPDGQSTFWDDRRTEAVESRDRIIALAMRDALADLETRLFKTADMTRWRWGAIHYATIEFPGLGAQLASFNLPSGLLLDRPAGYPRAGAIETVDVAEFGYSTFPVEVGYEGPAMRMVVETEPEVMRAWAALAGGVSDTYPGAGLLSPVQVRSDLHYGDQLPLWLRGEYRPQLLFLEDVTAVAEARFTLAPPD